MWIMRTQAMGIFVQNLRGKVNSRQDLGVVDSKSRVEEVILKEIQKIRDVAEKTKRMWYSRRQGNGDLRRRW